MKNSLLLILCLSMLTGFIVNATKLHSNGGAQRPVIGILSSPFSETDPSRGSFIQSHYVGFLESSGARVVPILYDWSESTLLSMLQRVNGILFTGGGLSLEPGTRYYKTAEFIFKTSKAMHSKGDYLPLWGTCMGFQLLCVLSANNRSILLNYAFDSESINWPLIFNEEEIKTSKLFGAASTSLLKSLQTQEITVNLHHDGVQPIAWKENPSLTETLKVLSTNYDRKGKIFVSTVEGNKLPIFATQWHPERPAFCWDPEENSTHVEAAIEAGQWVSRRFVEMCKLSVHSFESDDTIPLIEKVGPVHTTYENSYKYAQQQI